MCLNVRATKVALETSGWFCYHSALRGGAGAFQQVAWDGASPVLDPPSGHFADSGDR